ncbi:MAG: AAA family ATPase, partial [Chloroflexi bacterium]|nr:AAA family ATPase [Chloroflexota bacterium]
MNASRFEVPVEKLRWRCDVGCFTFQCTDELEPLQEFIGQDRAVSAIEFGLGVDQPGYNIFVTGMSGTGKSSVVQSHLQE